MSEIVGIKLADWPLTSTNIEVFFDFIPSIKEKDFKYEERDNIYRAQNQMGLVSFWYWKPPENNGGFGHRTINIQMLNGETVTLKGPWSSNSNYVNRIFPDRSEIIEVSLATEKGFNKFTKKPFIEKDAGAATIELCCKLFGIQTLNKKDFEIFLCEKKIELLKNNPNNIDNMDAVAYLREELKRLKFEKE